MARRPFRFHVAVATILPAILSGALIAAAQEPPAQPPADAGAQAAAADPATRPEPDLDALFAELKAPDPGEGWRRAESDILRIWSRTGSASADYLRLRGEQALDAGDAEAAIGHLTALTDHAPDYAQGFQLRAVAYAMTGAFGPAADDIAHALTLEPRQFVALTQLGAMLEDIGQEERALQAFRASLAINPHQQDAQDAVTRLTRGLDGTAL